MARRPVNAPLGDGTAEHAERNVGPAQDYECATGTPVVAPFAAGRIVRWGTPKSDGGYALTGYATNGDYWVLQHLSEYRNAESAAEAEVVALSGNSGTKTTGAHLHHYVVIGGTRYNPEDIGLYSTPAATTVAPFTPTTQEEEDMGTIIYRSGGAVLIASNGALLELGDALTKITGVDGQATIDAFVAAGAKVIDLPRHEWDVIRVNLRAGRS